MEPKIFLSYRRDDAIAHTALIYKELAAHFGDDRVFMDIETIGYGANFEREIETNVGACNVLLAIIGPKWTSITDSEGRRRLDAPDDFVHHEIATALRRRGIRVIPILLEGATPPRKDELPADLERLASLNAFKIDDQRIKSDIENLIGAIEDQNLPRLLRWLKLLRAAWWIVPSAALVMLFAAWMSLFDALTLDTKIESITMALGSLFRQNAVSDQLVLIAINNETERHFGKSFDNNKTWRREHAQLIDALSRAGAKTIVFDIFLKEPSPYDEELITAIRSATRKGTAVIFGTLDGSSSIAGMREAGSDLGLLCTGTRLGYTTLVPLSVNGKTNLVALALSATNPRSTVEYVDAESNYILLRTPSELKKIAFSLQQEIVTEQKNCSALAIGDKAAQLILELRPLQQLRDPKRRVRYEDAVASVEKLSPNRIKGKIVLIGREKENEDIFDVFRGFRKERRHGFELHADAISTLLQETRIHSINQLGQFIIMVCMGALGAFARISIPLQSHIWHTRLYLITVFAAYIVIAILIYVVNEMLLNTAYHIGAFLIAYWLLGRVARRLKLLESNKNPTPV